jgi:hypothetical protein
MDSTVSPTQADPHHHGDVVLLAPNDLASAVEAVSRLAQDAAYDARRARMSARDFSGLPVTESRTGERLRIAAVNNGQLTSDRPSLGSRAMGSFARFALAACIGVGATLAWQSYGQSAKQMLATWIPHLGWVPSLPLISPSPGPDIAAPVAPPAGVEVPVLAAAPAQPPPLGQTEPDRVVLAAPSASSEPVQPEAIARDLTTIQQTLEQLMARQEEMARDIVKLQVAQEDIRRKISAPPPRQAAASGRQAVPTPLPAPTRRASQFSSVGSKP